MSKTTGQKPEQPDQQVGDFLDEEITDGAKAAETLRDLGFNSLPRTYGLSANKVALALLANPHVERLTGLTPQQPTRPQLEAFALNCARIAAYFNESVPRSGEQE